MNTITPFELKQKLLENEDIVLIDVREKWEHDEFNIGGILLPLGLILESDVWKTDKPVIFYCKKGIRSALAIQKIQQKNPQYNLINLIGGIEAWKKEIPAN